MSECRRIILVVWAVWAVWAMERGGRRMEREDGA